MDSVVNDEKLCVYYCCSPLPLALPSFCVWQTRQPSDSYAFDGGGATEEDLDLMFAPAAPAVVKRAKGNKVVLGKDQNASSSSKGGANTTPKSKTNRKNFENDETMSSPPSNKSTPTKAPPSSSSPGTPPLPSSKRKKETSGGIQDDDEDVDYKEWWMQCFPDAFKNLMPTR
jgi:hypothetical protein